MNELLAAAREDGRRRGRSDAESDLLRPNTDHVFDLYEVTDGRLSEWLAGYWEAWNAERGIVAPRISPRNGNPPLKPFAIDIRQELLRQYNDPVMSNIRRADYIEAVVATALRPSWVVSELVIGPRGTSSTTSPAAGWNRSGKWHDDPGRHAHVYVFAWHPEAKPSADQRDPSSWLFYVTPESELPTQKTIGLRVIRGMAEPCRIGGLPDELVRMALPGVCAPKS